MYESSFFKKHANILLLICLDISANLESQLLIICNKLKENTKLSEITMYSVEESLAGIEFNLSYDDQPKKI